MSRSVVLMALCMAAVCLCILRVTWDELGSSEAGEITAANSKITALLASTLADIRAGRKSSRADAASNRSQVEVLYMNAYKPLDHAVPGTNLTDACKRASGSVGNLVWMHGAGALLKSPWPRNFRLSSLTDIRLASYRAKALYFPAANMLPNQSLFKGSSGEYLRRSLQMSLQAIKLVGGPTLLLGVGLQGTSSAALTFNAPSDAGAGTARRLLDNYHPHELSLQIFDAVQSRQGYIVARGEHTASIIRAHGFDRVVTAGCPSILANPSAGLGARVEARLASLVRRLGSTPALPAPLVAVSLPAHFEPALFGLLLRVVVAGGGNRLVVQDEGDLQNLRKAEQELRVRVPERQVAWFTSVAAWGEFLSCFDFILGGRIHGTIAGLVRGVPALLIVRDVETVELARAMLLPHSDPSQPWFQDASRLNVTAAVRSIVGVAAEVFNGSRFDRRRCSLSRIYGHLFQVMRLDPNPALAGLCDDPRGGWGENQA